MRGLLIRDPSEAGMGGGRFDPEVCRLRAGKLYGRFLYLKADESAKKSTVPNPRRERSGPGGLFVFIRPSPDLFSIDLHRFFGPQGSVIRPE